MEETTQKICCVPYNNCSSDAWTAAALMKDSGNSAAEMAALLNNGGMNGMWNNPFIYLVWMMFAGRMFNGWGDSNGTAENYNSRQIAALQDTVNTNHNNDLAMQAINGNTNAIAELAGTFNTSFNTMQTAICGVKSAIEQVGGQVGLTGERVINSVLMGNKDLQAAIQSCCCENKLLVTNMGYQNQLGQKDLQNAFQGRIDQLANGVQQGFTQIGYQDAQNTATIVNAINAAQQKTSDLLTTHWTAELSQALQDEKFKNSQLTQTQQLLSAISGGNCPCAQA